METGLEEIVRRLDGEPSSDDSYDAQDELLELGPDVLPTVVRLLPTLTPFGQLSAIEVFERFGDATCAPALIDLLCSEHETVREWAALALGQLGIADATGEIWTAYWAAIDLGVPPDWTEPCGMRWALTRLGARRPLLPSLSGTLVRSEHPTVGHTWRVADLDAVVKDLANHNQAVLGFQCWRERANDLFGVDAPFVDRGVDWTAPWSELVAVNLEWSMLEAGAAPRADDIVVTVDWIADSDLRR